MIFTSSWTAYKGPGRIGISRGSPRFGVGSGYRFYRALAPSADILFNTAGVDDYRPRFEAEILAPLDPDRVAADLYRLADGHVPVLLCFEKVPLTRDNFCHRTMVADWLNRHGHECREWSRPEESNLLSGLDAPT